MQRTDQIGALTLLEVFGHVLPRATSRGPKLQRIYGTAYSSKKELKAHLHRIEEARRSATTAASVVDLGLFTIDPVTLARVRPSTCPRAWLSTTAWCDFMRDLYPKLRLPGSHHSPIISQ